MISRLNTILVPCLVLTSLVEDSRSFGIVVQPQSSACATGVSRAFVSSPTCRPLFMAEDDDGDAKEDVIDVEVEKVQELVTDDLWIAFTIKLAKAINEAVIPALEKMKDVAIDAADVTYEIDMRIKQEVANYRGKVRYEMGDLTRAIDETVKEVVEKATGKTVEELGSEIKEISMEIDKTCKKEAAEFCNKQTYEVGDISREIDRRAKISVAEFTGKDTWELGDVAREVEKRRIDWINGQKFLVKKEAVAYLRDFEAEAIKAVDDLEKESQGFLSKVFSKVKGFFS